MKPADDRMAVSRVFEESWKFAYRGIVPQAYLDSIPEGRWVNILDEPGWTTLICVDEGRIVGTTFFCRSRLESYADWGEIGAIYLLPEYMGKGYGKALIESAIAELNLLGFDKIYLWVLEENKRGRRFYEKMGFSFSGESMDIEIGGKVLREVRYVFETEIVR
jgi:GNAT superfamily N-acetyltransferase